MAVELIATIQVFQGNTSDEKPFDAPIGSQFRELDGDKDTWSLTSAGWKVSTVNNVVRVERMGDLLDVLERVQQQMSKVNEDENLSPGERHYGNS